MKILEHLMNHVPLCHGFNLDDGGIQITDYEIN